MSCSPPTIIELNMNELEDILRRAEARELKDEDYETIKQILQSYVHLMDLLKDKTTRIDRLRKLLFGASTEKTKDVCGSGTAEGTPPSGAEEDSAEPTEPTAEEESVEPTEESAEEDSAEPTQETTEEKEPVTRAPGHGRNGADAYTGAERIEVPHPSLEPGDRCPECGDGTVYETSRPGVLVRLVGQAPVQAKVYKLQKLRCNLCGKVFTAEAPEGVGSEKYDATSASMIALLKYGSGLPFNRLQGLQGNLGIPLPTSTQWDIVHATAEAIEPVYHELIWQAAQGDVLHNDDTTMRILELMGKRAERAALTPPSVEGAARSGQRKRTGMFTSGIVSTREGRRIALFFSGRQHAGENLTDVLARRAAALGPPIQMCDALSRNMPAELDTIVANCLAHGRRKFVDVAEHFPDECRHVLEALGVIYKNDALARNRNLSPEARLHFHQAESGSTMEQLQAWLTRQLEDRLVEPHSGLGEAISYMLKHWEPLTLFLREPGAPLDNNICERALKKAILHRKNAMFYLSENGAHVGDLFMSLIYTCEFCGANPFDYLTELQRHADELPSNSRAWMPWNYRQTLDGTAPPTGTAP